jgi:hypothetical protein
MHRSEDNSDFECDLTRFDFAWSKKVLAAAGVAYIANNRYDREMAIAALTPANPKTFYSPGPEGYTNYPRLATTN